MELLVVSDLHTEMVRQDDQNAIMKSLLSGEFVDAIILAGDILNKKNAARVIEYFANEYKDVVLVTGNHEYYGFYLHEVDDELERLNIKYSNFHYLNAKRGRVQIQDRYFWGDTLWYPMNTTAWKLAPNWSDFHYIKMFTKELVEELNDQSITSFVNNVQKEDIIVTHMAPSHKSINKKWIGNEFNCFFTNNLDELIKEYQPTLWIHGHMHDPVDYKIENTRVIANPRAYTWRGEGKEFDPAFVIKI